MVINWQCTWVVVVKFDSQSNHDDDDDNQWVIVIPIL